MPSPSAEPTIESPPPVLGPPPGLPPPAGNIGAQQLPPVPEESDSDLDVPTTSGEPEEELLPPSGPATAPPSRRSSDTQPAADAQSASTRTTNTQPTTSTPLESFAQGTLQRALRRSPDALDGMPNAARSLQQHDADRSRSPAPLTRGAPSERSAFVGFLARRTKAKTNAARAKELHLNKSTPERKQKMLAARAKEWMNWTSFEATTVLPPAEAAKFLKEHPEVEVIPTRWVDTLKSEPWEEDRHKARMVVRGDLEKDSELRTDSPTCSQQMLSFTLALAAGRRWPVFGGDITAAFLQGESITRQLVLSLPKDGVEGVEEGSIMIANKPVYGTRDAPRGFWKKLAKTAKKHGLREVPFEPAAYSLSNNKGELLGLVVSHVDDLLWTGGPEMTEVMLRLQQDLKFGSLDEGNFTYCGRLITQEAEGIRVTCPNTAAKVRAIHLTAQRRKQRDLPATESETSQLRSVLGSLGWVGRVCRPDISYELSALQAAQKQASVQDLLDANRLLYYVQKTPEAGVFYKYGAVDIDRAILLSVTDASYAADYDTSSSGQVLGNRSQSGRLLFLADPSFLEKGEGEVYLLQHHSNGIRRVCRSTLQAETLNMVSGLEEAEHMRAVMFGMRHVLQGDWQVRAMDAVTIQMLTDCRSLEAHLLQSGMGTTSDKRLSIDMSALRQMIWRENGEAYGDPLNTDGIPAGATTKVEWIETKSMPADALTKRMRSEQLHLLMAKGTLKIDRDRSSKKAGSRPV